MKKLSKLFILTIFLSIFVSSPVLAATTNIVNNKITTPSKAIILATVNIQNVKIISQKENIFNISFSLSNREGLQTGVKYGVKLVKTINNVQSVADEKVYDEVLTLNPNSIINKTIIYTAPSLLNGNYSLILVSNNISGFPFAITNAGDVKLVSTTLGVQILPDSCSLKVLNEKGSPVYTLIQGVDIKNDENLSLTCTAFNSSKSDIKAIPSYETHYRTSFGSIVPQNGGDIKPIVIKAGEKKSFSVVLPKASLSQSYNVDLFLNNNDQKSNPISVHYVLRGASASIQNISLNKDYYKRGEAALISFVFTPSADSFTGSRFGKTTLNSVKSKIEITNGKGKSCSKIQENVIPNDSSPKVDSSLPITSSCLDPIVSVTLTDASGIVLDQKELKIVTSNQTKTDSNNIYIITIIILIIIVLVFIYIKRKKTPTAFPLVEDPSKITNTISVNIILPFLFFLALFGFIPTAKVSADSFYLDGRWVVVQGPTKTNYTPGEQIPLFGAVYDASCMNSGPNVAGSIYAYISGTSQGNKYLYDHSLEGVVTSYDLQALSAPTSGGSYNVTFEINVHAGTSYYTVPESYTPCVDCNGLPEDYWCQQVSYYNTWYVVWDQCSSDAPKYVYTPAVTTTTQNWTSTSYDIPFTVLVPTVTVSANGSEAGATIKYGETPDIRWSSVNATSCICTYKKPDNSNGDCGSGTGIGVAGKNVPLTKTTTFTVVCN
jgi:hypothetical protein